jgi:tetratricopeptide (TPR) repeat protein
MRISLFIILFLSVVSVKAQKTNQYILKGNDDYKLREYTKAEEEYLKALKADGKNPVAQFNSGNAKHKLNKYEEAAKQFETAAQSSSDPLFKADAYNNLGLSYIKQKRLSMQLYCNSLTI